MELNSVKKMKRHSTIRTTWTIWNTITVYWNHFLQILKTPREAALLRNLPREATLLRNLHREAALLKEQCQEIFAHFLL